MWFCCLSVHVVLLFFTSTHADVLSLSVSSHLFFSAHVALLLFLPHVFQLIIRFGRRAFVVPLFRIDVILCQGLLCHPPLVQAPDVHNPVHEVEVSRFEIFALGFVQATDRIEIWKRFNGEDSMESLYQQACAKFYNIF